MTLSTISIANAGGATDSLSQVMTGQTKGIGIGSTVDLYDNDAATPVGTAIVTADGSWSTDIVLAYGDNILVASTTGPDGSTVSSAAVDYELAAVLSPPTNVPSSSVQSSPVPATGSDDGGYRHVVGPHPLHSTFTFGPASGQTLLTDFHLGGRGHDIISLPASRFASIAAVLHGLHDIGGDAVISFSPKTSITVEGISAAELRAHPQDFRLHG